MVFYCGMIMVYIDRHPKDVLVEVEMEEQPPTPNGVVSTPFVEVYPFNSYLSVDGLDRF